MTELVEKDGYVVVELEISDNQDTTVDRMENLLLEDPVWRFQHNYNGRKFSGSRKGVGPHYAQ